MSKLVEIDRLTKVYADARTLLGERVTELNDALEYTKRRRLLPIKNAVAKAKEAEANLHAALSDSKELFAKPKTIILHGIKVGYEKGKGKIEWDDKEKVVTLIKKHFADQVDILIKTKQSPVKKALQNLSVQELKKLGISVEESGDAVVIRPTDSNVDKLVKALLAEKAVEDDEEED